jgi:hypothetical protein
MNMFALNDEYVEKLTYFILEKCCSIFLCIYIIHVLFARVWHSGMEDAAFILYTFF